jgi:hypothetical protein
MTKLHELRRALAARLARAQAEVASAGNDRQRAARIVAAARTDTDAALREIAAAEAAEAVASLPAAQLAAATTPAAVEKVLGELVPTGGLGGAALLAAAHGTATQRDSIDVEAARRVETSKKPPDKLTAAELLTHGHELARRSAAGGS